MTWALIELCKHQDKQEALRNELSRFQGSDPSWEELWSGLPYLHAVVQETLRLHPPLAGISRVASQDDIIPLTSSITTAAGEVVSQIVIAKGTPVNCPVAYINQAEELWGPDAKEFKPERWLVNENGVDGIGEGAKAIQGYHHLLTFSDGPRLCLGRNFAIGNFKVSSLPLMTALGGCKRFCRVIKRPCPIEYSLLGYCSIADCLLCFFC